MLKVQIYVELFQWNLASEWIFLFWFSEIKIFIHSYFFLDWNIFQPFVAKYIVFFISIICYQQLTTKL